MKPTLDPTGVPMVYAGRFANEVSESLPDSEVLDEWEVLPHQLAGATREASSLVVFDPLSFPFEAMTNEQWHIPLLVIPPPEFDAETLITIFGSNLFEHLGPFDRIATADQKLWDTLRRKYSWANSQRIRLSSGIPAKAAAELRGLFDNLFGYSRREKAAHRIEAGALTPQIDALRQTHADAPLHVLEVGSGNGNWPTSFDLSETHFIGVYMDEEAVKAARRDFPECNFFPPGKDFRIVQSGDAFDLSFSVNFMQVQPDLNLPALISEMWRVTRPGESMIFLEDFVTGASGDTGISPLSVSEFVDLALEATGGRVILDHVESLLYPEEDMYSGGLISLRKLGGPDDR